MAPIEKPLIVVPTYNELDNIDTLLGGVRENAPGADVLFVDDNSQDGTFERESPMTETLDLSVTDDPEALRRLRSLGCVN